MTQDCTCKVGKLLKQRAMLPFTQVIILNDWDGDLISVTANYCPTCGDKLFEYSRNQIQIKIQPSSKEDEKENT